MFRLCSLLCLLALPAAADPAGPLRVIDGDTVAVDGVTVRLFGIDAPERDQLCQTVTGEDWPCGIWASDELERRFGGLVADCTVRDIDDYGRSVATCRAGDQDIGQVLVRNGIALAYRQYSWDYDLDEKSAQVEGLGLWAGRFEEPASYRAEARAAANAATGDCVIKGNISDAGRVYHVPGQRDYDATRISEGRGERWFCTPAEAEAAGWRPARQ